MKQGLVTKSKSSRKVPSSTAISVVTSTTATSTSTSCTITSTCRSRLRTLKLAESQSEPLIVQQDSSGFHLVDSSFSKGSIPSASSASYSSSFITIDPGSGAIDTPTVMPTFGFQDRLRSQPVSSSVKQDGLQLQSNRRTHDGFQLLSSRPSRQIDSGDRQITKSSTNRKKKTHRPASDREAKVFLKRMGKNLYRQNSFKLCQRIRNSFDFKTFSE